MQTPDYWAPIPSWWDTEIAVMTEEFLRILDETFGPIGAAEWGGEAHVHELCEHLLHEPDEDAYRAALGLEVA